MTDLPTISRPAHGRVRFVIVSVLLALTFVALLWVPSYAHLTPTLAGFPFFYWYSLLWLVINAISQIIAYQVIVVRSRPSRRAAQ